MEGIFPAWGRILQGYRPNLSIEITRECPLRCPGCYAYGDEHLGGGQTLRTLSDRKGQALIDGILDVVDRHQPLHLSIVGGEPLVRYPRARRAAAAAGGARALHPGRDERGAADSRARGRRIQRLQICVSIDGLQPEHDVRRTPATYDRILKHIEGHQITVHCTVTRQQVQRDGYIEEFVQHVVRQSERADDLDEPLHAAGRRGVRRAAATGRSRARRRELLALRERFPKLQMPKGLLDAYLRAAGLAGRLHLRARRPSACRPICRRAITPCQFGGKPDCASCGCMASAGLAAVGRHRLRAASASARSSRPRSRSATPCALAGLRRTLRMAARSTAARSSGGLHAGADVRLAEPLVKLRLAHRAGRLRRRAADHQRPALARAGPRPAPRSRSRPVPSTAVMLRSRSTTTGGSVSACSEMSRSLSVEPNRNGPWMRKIAT